jgi:eukaryotic-like serine/threonine-protein kinase
MPLSVGDKLGPYEILAPIGVGGMGEVYRAKDTKLDREVALKALPDDFAEDSARLARFEREAKVLASLNHPNIAQIYGLENRALVMELVPGETLGSLLKPGPLPVEIALNYAKQIAEALEAAHEKGIIHRDLKPANIMVTPEGIVKVLDFGLAAVSQGSMPASGDPVNSPTLTIRATQAGMIMGTAAYMSPEQARGAAVDRRADIWAFGVVLLEMFTGVTPFRGETISDTLAGVLRAPIDWKSLPPDTPPAARRLLERCLERDPKRRLRDIGEARVVLSEPDILTPPAPAPPAARIAARWRRPAVWAVLVLGAAAFLAAGIWMATLLQDHPSPGVTRLSILLPAGQVLTGGGPAVSRDGRFISYTARGADGLTRLYVRALNSFESTEVPDSEGARLPFFAPNADRIGFFARQKMLIAPRAGGAPVAIADASYIPIGATWGENDTIYYVPALSSGILSIPASGGKPRKLTEPDEAEKGYAHVWPQYLFDIQSVLFSVWGGQNQEANGTLLLSPSNGSLIRVSPTLRSSIYVRSGHLLASGMHGVTAAAFNPARPQEVRPNTSVLEDVFASQNVSTSWFAVSDTGTLVYVPGDPSLSTMAWVDRAGVVTPYAGKPQSMTDPALSPDGTRVAMNVDLDIWLRDLRLGTNRRLTFDNEGVAQLPIWSHDGSRVIFASNRTGDWDLYSVSASGGPATRLLARKGTQYPVSVAPNGTLIFSERSRATGNGADLWTLAPDGTASPFIVSPASKIDGQFSPDGRLVAYVSDESGRYEVYLRFAASPAGAVAVSSEGGTEPKWSPDGKELFYRRGDAFFLASVNSTGTLSVSESRKLFETPALYGRYSNHAGYAVSPDGRRLLILRPDPRAIPRQINVVLNWFEELNAKVPSR